MKKNKEQFNKIGVSTKSQTNKRFYSAGLLDHIDEGFAEEVQDYWRDKTSKKVDPGLHLAFLNLTGKKVPELIPSRIMNYEVLPVLNDYNMTAFYSDKNIYDLFIKPSRSAVTVLRNIRGNYYDKDYQPLDLEKAKNLLLDNEKGLIIKASKSNNGTGVKKLDINKNEIYIDEEKLTIEELLKKFGGNFVVQEMLEQHPNMAAPHPESVNTIRMVTFRWNNEIKYLFAFARFGSGGDIRDNANVDSSPRIGIKDSGEFFKYGIGQSGEKYTHHPTTGYNLADLKPIPNYDEFKQFVIDSHKNFLHLDFVSWDIAVGKDGKPVFIEANFAGTTWFYQLATQQSMFGNLTDEVMEYVQHQLKTSNKALMKKHLRRLNKRNRAKLKKEREENKRQISNLKAELEKQKSINSNFNPDIEQELNKSKENFKKEKQQLIKERDRYKKEYEKIQKSNSWRITSPIRKISSQFKKK